ncbi:MAG: TIGR01777 family protein [Planctomycetes bacterium]|nr:TIGR01777 family protein [Planctomycetota bacterium]
MRVLLTGGTGFIGAPLAGRLLARGDQVTVVTRDARAAADRLPPGAVPAEPPVPVEGYDAVVNLAGEPIFGRRWDLAQKDAVRLSRVGTTAALVRALAAAKDRPKVLVSASAIGYYGPREGPLADHPLDEECGPGNDFLADVCREWEAEGRRAEGLGIRTVILRIGVVVGAGGGALAQMLTPFKLFVGGPVGNGRQWLSWIHRDDLLSMITWAIDESRVRGPLNGVAPNAERNLDFSRGLARALGRPCWAPVPPFALRWVMGEVADVIANGQRVTPKKALELGFAFKYPGLEAALKEAVG